AEPQPAATARTYVIRRVDSALRYAIVPYHNETGRRSAVRPSGVRVMSAPTPAIDPRVHARRWWILGVLSLSLVIIGLDNTVLNVALPPLQRTFGASAS